MDGGIGIRVKLFNGPADLFAGKGEPLDTLMIGVSGIRGVVGSTLTPDIVAKFSAAFGTYCGGGTIVIGRDARRSGPMIRDAVAAGLRSSGCKVIDLGVVSTPTIQFSVTALSASGGVAITASHNPIEWNALKFIDRTGIFLDAKQGEKLLSIYNNNEIRYAPWDSIGELVEDAEANERHANRILRVIDTSKVADDPPMVVIDCCNSAPSGILLAVLEKIGCEVSMVNCDMSGAFPRGPEPLSENLTALSQKVREVGADIGFATDPDGDRVSVVTDRGQPVGEEYSLVIASNFVLEKQKGPVVTNVATTNAVEEVARRWGCDFYRAPVGEVNVVKKMIEVGAVIGGEGNGGVINPKVQYARDAAAAMALILEGVSRSGKKISTIVRGLPTYHMVKKKIPCPPERARIVLKEVASRYEGESIDLSDGVRITLDSDWIYFRKSATEPVIRVICESRKQERAEQLADEAVKLVKSILAIGV